VSLNVDLEARVLTVRRTFAMGRLKPYPKTVIRKRQISTCRPMTAVRSWGSRKCSTELAALWAIAR
jgi:hypothetical protein